MDYVKQFHQNKKRRKEVGLEIGVMRMKLTNYLAITIDKALSLRDSSALALVVTNRPLSFPPSQGGHREV